MKSFEEESCVLNFYQIGHASLRSKTLAGLLIESIMNEHIHNTFYKKEPYCVRCKLIDDCGVLAYTIHIQTVENACSVDDFDKIIEDIRRGLMTIIVSLTADEFEQHKSKWLESRSFDCVDLKDEVDMNWTEIMNGSQWFGLKESEILANITQSEAINFYHDHFAVGKRKLSIQTIADSKYFVSHLSPDDVEYNGIVNEKIEKAENNLVHVNFSEVGNDSIVDSIDNFKNILEKYRNVQNKKRKN